MRVSSFFLTRTLFDDVPMAAVIVAAEMAMRSSSFWSGAASERDEEKIEGLAETGTLIGQF